MLWKSADKEPQMKLKEKVILITGGGRGIGKAIAIHYGREGAKLALCARTAAELEQTVKELRAMNVDAEGWSCDVSLEEPVRRISSSTRTRNLAASMCWSTTPGS